MGNEFKKQTTVTQELVEVRRRASVTAGQLAITARYHQLPKRLEDDYVVEEKALGHGVNGSVMLVHATSTGKRYAMKPFRTISIGKAERRVLRNEVHIFLSMDHPHVCRLVDVYESKSEIHLVMECLEGGELFDRIQKRSCFREIDAKHTVWQMLLAVNYLHSMNIVHRDIKCENFMYESKASDHLKLIDFGFSRVHKTTDKRMMLSCGTINYAAPEVLNRSYTEKCDLWSIGVVSFILLMGYMPFKGTDEQVTQHIREGRYDIEERPWSRLSDDAKKFVQGLLQVDVEQRLSAPHALAHSWMAEVQQAQAVQRSFTKDSMTPGAPVSDVQAYYSSFAEGLCSYAKASNFRRACMQTIAWSLSTEERARLHNVFASIDQAHNGTISVWEMKEAMQRSMTITDTEVQVIFDAIDNNNDQKINYTEFLSAMVSTRIQLHDELIQASFKRFDTEGTGYITKADLKKVFQDVYSAQEIEEMIREADLDNDDQLSFEDFLQYLRGDSEARHQNAAERLIDVELSKHAQEQGGGSRSLSPGHAIDAGEGAPALELERNTSLATHPGEDGAQSLEFLHTPSPTVGDVRRKRIPSVRFDKGTEAAIPHSPAADPATSGDSGGGDGQGTKLIPARDIPSHESGNEAVDQAHGAGLANIAGAQQPGMPTDGSTAALTSTSALPVGSSAAPPCAPLGVAAGVSADDEARVPHAEDPGSPTSPTAWSTTVNHSGNPKATQKSVSCALL